MIDAIFSQPGYLGAKKMLDATVLRHQAIATNIANLETPRYRRVDLAPAFETELRRATASGQAEQIRAVQPRLALDTTSPPSGQDGNTVHLEQEMLELGRNSVQHALETQLVSGTLLKLRLAITGRPV